MSRLLLWLLVALLLIAASFVAALIESVALVPTLVMGVSFLGLFVALILGLLTRRWSALKVFALLFVTSTVGNIPGYLTYLHLRCGEEATAEAIVHALAEHRRTQGNYPEKLEALVPKYLGTLPAAPFGQSRAPYFYLRQGEEFILSYPTGFHASRRYESRTQRWESFD